MSDTKKSTPELAYESLSAEQKDAINLRLLAKWVPQLHAGEYHLRPGNEVSDQAFLDAQRTIESGATTTTRPTRTAIIEMILESDRESYAQDKEFMVGLVGRYKTLKAQTPEYRMGQGTEQIDKLIALDGDQFDVTGQLPAIRALKQRLKGLEI